MLETRYAFSHRGWQVVAAFFNANVPPLPRDGIETREIGDNAKTINEQGVTIFPLDVRMMDNDEAIFVPRIQRTRTQDLMRLGSFPPR